MEKCRRKFYEKEKVYNISKEKDLNIIRPYLRDMIDNHKAHSK